MELLLIDPVLDAKQALALGLVHEIVPDDRLLERARAVLTQLAHGPTTAFGGAKALVNATLFPMLETQLERERQRLVTQAGTENFLEWLSVFMQKKNPHFRADRDHHQPPHCTDELKWLLRLFGTHPLSCLVVSATRIDGLFVQPVVVQSRCLVCVHIR